MTFDVENLTPDVRDQLTTLLVQGGHLVHPLNLCAHVETDMSDAALREVLAQRLPSHMVPDQVITAPSLPRLPNGKLDRGALQTMSSPPNGAEIISPQQDTFPSDSPALEPLRTIWSDVLGMSPIENTDSFVELGGDSLLSISVVSRARKAGIEILPSDLFDYATLQELAQRVRLIKPQESLPNVMDGPLDLTTSAQDEEAPHLFLLNANRRMLDQLEGHLTTPRTLHLMTLHWDSGDVGGLDTIEALAADFLARIREIKPHGPYSIGGFSIGAVAAHEIALQLTREGVEVRDIILIDPPENPDLFASSYHTAHRFSGGRNEEMNVLRNLRNEAARITASLFKKAGFRLPRKLKSRAVAAAYFKAARHYQIEPPAVKPIIVRRIQKSGTSMWAKRDEQHLLFEIECSHADFHREEHVIQKWTAPIAKSLEHSS